MSATSPHIAQVYQLRVELLKAVDDIGRETGQTQLPGAALSEHNLVSLVDLMRQTLQAARITLQFITILVENNSSSSINPKRRESIEIILPEVYEESGSENKSQNINYTGLLQKGSATMRSDDQTTRSPAKTWCSSEFSAFENVTTKRKRDTIVNNKKGVLAKTSLEEVDNDENSNHSTRRLETSCDELTNKYDEDEEVIIGFLEPCLPCTNNKSDSRASSRAGDSFLDASVSSVDTSNVNLRRKKRKLGGVSSAESSVVDDFTSNSFAILDPADLSLSRDLSLVPDISRDLSAATNKSLSRIPAATSISRDISSTQPNLSSLSPHSSSSAATSGDGQISIFNPITAASGTLTPPVSENGQASPKSVDDSDPRTYADVAADRQPQTLSKVVLPPQSTSGCSASGDTPTKAAPLTSVQQTSDKFSPFNHSIKSSPRIGNGIDNNGMNDSSFFQINFDASIGDSSQFDQVLSCETGEFESLNYRGSPRRRTSNSNRRYSSGFQSQSLPLASSNVPFSDCNSPNKSRGKISYVKNLNSSVAKSNTIEVISLLDSSSEDSCSEAPEDSLSLEEQQPVPVPIQVQPVPVPIQVQPVPVPIQVKEELYQPIFQSNIQMKTSPLRKLSPVEKDPSIKLTDSLNKKHLDFGDVCQINISLFETPELLRGAGSWCNWRLTPVDKTTRRLNTPLESSTPVTAKTPNNHKTPQVNNHLDNQLDDEDKPVKDFVYTKPDLIRQSYLRLTPARLKYSRSMKEIPQDNRHKLIILNDTRLKDEAKKDVDDVIDTAKSKTKKDATKSAYRPMVTFQSESVLTRLGSGSTPAKLYSNHSSAKLGSAAATTPAKKKTMSRSKAAVSLVKPPSSPESPPSTPKKRCTSRKPSKVTILESLDEEEAASSSSAVKPNHFVPEHIDLNKEGQTLVSGTEESHTKDVDHLLFNETTKADTIGPDASLPHLEMTKTPENMLKLDPTELTQVVTDEKPPKRRINFGPLSIYYFSRIQGWGAVPKEGGNTLGMKYKHFDHELKDMDPEETDEMEKKHGLSYLSSPCKTLKSNVSFVVGEGGMDQGKPLYFDGGCDTEATDASLGCWPLDNNTTSMPARKMRASARSDSTPCLLDMSRPNGLGASTPARPNGLGSSTAASMLDLRAAVSMRKKGESGTRGLYKISSKSRKGILKNSGIKDLDPMEALEIKVLRQSRMECGCSCTGECKPGTCECVDAGIQCHEEKGGFPCSCSTRCTNPEGVRRFDPLAVKMHHIQTMLTVQGALDIK